MIFEVFEDVLADLDSSGEEMFGDAWHLELRAAVERLAGYYGNQNLRNAQRELIDYGGLGTQAVYIYMYAIGRAEFTYQLLKRYRAQAGQPLFKGPSLNVTSIGGGPASELVGLVKYLDEFADEGVTEILYDVLDKESRWEPLAELVVEKIPSDIEITLRFEEFDLTNEEGIGETSVQYDDLVMMSFFVSEICELPNPKIVKENLEALLGSIKNGAKLFYNDSDAYSFYKYMNYRAGSVKGLRETLEIQDMIVFDYANPGETFLDYSETLDRTPHLSSKAVSKLYERS